MNLKPDGLSLRASVFAPDVQHEDGGDEEKRHHEHRNWANLDTRGVVGVEAPHTTGSGACGTIPCCRGSRGCFALLQVAGTASGRSRGRRGLRW